MLRSFDYARAVAARQFAATPPRGRRGRRGAARGMARGGAYGVRRARTATRSATARCIRESGATASACSRLATLERLFYEIRYELEQRPDWVAVPLRDLRAATIADR